ncbi:MAG: PRTRC system protein D [Rhodocyclaceae bacterium]|nr:PRTRC system protein D [Rhodocyclaceae bacterium]
MEQTVIRSIDVGYGNTKFISNRNYSKNTIRAALFPSFAPRCMKSQDESIASGFMKQRDTVRVLIDSDEYEVGPDAQKAQFGNESGRVLKEDYCLSDTYRALTYGALNLMQQPHIDVLVLGLPMSTWRKYKDALALKMTGTHRITHDFSCTIVKVLVAPQPIGGFYDYGLGIGQFRTLQDQMNLIIDPGYYTLDWLLADGITPVEARSNAVNNGGMAEVIRAVTEQVATDFDSSVSEIGSHENIDRSIRDGKPIRVFGKNSKRPIDYYFEIAKERALDPLLKLVQSVGPAGSIDNIILVGGGAHVFADLVRNEFPKHDIKIIHDGIYANVRGFQLIGETWARNNINAGEFK